MTVLSRSSVAKPTLPKETVTVESLGGDVVVRGLLLTQRLTFVRELTKTGDRNEDVIAALPTLLAQAVVDDKGEQFWTADEWQVFGATHQSEALELFNTAMRLSGFAGEDTAKN